MYDATSYIVKICIKKFHDLMYNVYLGNDSVWME